MRRVMSPHGAAMVVYGTAGHERLALVEWMIAKNAEEGVHCDPAAIRRRCAEVEGWGLLIDEDRYEELWAAHQAISRGATAASTAPPDAP